MKKNTLKMLGIIAFAVIIGFSMTACGDPPESPTTYYDVQFYYTNPDQSPLTVTWGSPVQVASGSTVAPKSTTTLSIGADKIFDGWYTNSALLDNQKYNFASPVNSNLNLYGKVVDKIVITFDLGYNAPDIVVNVPINRDIPVPSNPTRDGFTFNGWLLDDNPYSFAVPANNKATDSITLVASWSISLPEPPEPPESNVYAIIKIVDNFTVLTVLDFIALEDFSSIEEQTEYIFGLATYTSIGNAINFIHSDADDNDPCTIYFGADGMPGFDVLDIGDDVAVFNSGWSNKEIYLEGNITSSNNAVMAASMGTIRFNGVTNVNITSYATITNTSSNSSTIQFTNSSSGNLNIIDGMIDNGDNPELTSYAIDANFGSSNVNINLGGSPEILGNIRPSGDGKFILIDDGDDIFVPLYDYSLSYLSYAANMVVVKNGVGLEEYFTLIGTLGGLSMQYSGSDIVVK